MSQIISVRLNDKEEELLRREAKFHGQAPSTLMKTALWEWMEDQHDYRVASRAYQNHLKSPQTISHAEMMEEFVNGGK